MSRATVLYIAIIVACAAGLWAIIAVGGRLRAPTDLSGVWSVGGEDPTAPEHLGESVVIEQSGRFVRLNFANGLVVDAKMTEDQPPTPDAGKNLDVVFEGPDWKVIAFGSSADGPLIFRLVGRERHTFTATRKADVPEIPEAPEAADPDAEAETTATATPTTPRIKGEAAHASASTSASTSASGTSGAAAPPADGPTADLGTDAP